MDAPIERVAGQRGAAGGRDAVAPPRRDAARSSTPKPTRSDARSARASPSSRRTAASSAIPSSVPTELRTLENHAGRPEIAAVAQPGPRHRAPLQHHARPPTCSTSRFRSANPDAPLLAEVRLALPLTEHQHRSSQPCGRLALVAFGAGLLAALALAWAASALLSRRVRAIAGVAERYARAISRCPVRDYGNDEIGTVARVPGRLGPRDSASGPRISSPIAPAWKRSSAA